MAWTAPQILDVLDRCCEDFSFPMLDNGYVYLAATRLSLFRSDLDWAMVFEVFGFSPRTGVPDLHVSTVASRLHNRNPPGQYTSPSAHENYLGMHPFDDSRFFYPIADAHWQDPEDLESVAQDARVVNVRGRPVSLPSTDAYVECGIELSAAPRVRVFELCRLLAATHRDDVLATPEERRISVLPGMQQSLVLDDWNHPDICDPSCRPSGSQTFQQLAEVLATGDVSRYRPDLPPNTHWRYWPDGGSL